MGAAYEVFWLLGNDEPTRQQLFIIVFVGGGVAELLCWGLRKPGLLR